MDAKLIEALLALGHLDLVVFDFDGVMTDNTVFVLASGEEMVRCHRGDGLGIGKLAKRGVPMLILSTEVNPVVRARAGKLKLECHHGIGDKELALRELLAARGIDPRHVIFVGNDENDAGCLTTVGLPIVVADAHASVAGLARVRLAAKGGKGAVRELADAIVSLVDAGRLRVGPDRIGKH